MNTPNNTPFSVRKFLAIASIAAVALPISAQAQSITQAVSFDDAGLQHGSLFSGSEFADSGVVFSVDSNGRNRINQLLIFDTNVNNTADSDLQTPFAGGNLGGVTNLGNALIIAENLIDANGDGLVDSPDDEARGGTITASFASDNVTSVGFNLYDTPENADSEVSILFSGLTARGTSHTVTFDIDDLIAHGTDVEFADSFANEFRDITAEQLGLVNINRIDFNIESGAIDQLTFTTVPEPSSVALLGLGAVGMMFRRRRA